MRETRALKIEKVIAVPFEFVTAPLRKRAGVFQTVATRAREVSILEQCDSSTDDSSIGDSSIGDSSIGDSSTECGQVRPLISAFFSWNSL